MKKLVLKWLVFSVGLTMAAGSALADLNLANGYASGQWYNPARDGEGFFVEIIDTSGNLQISVAMYSYNELGEQLWLVGNAPIAEGDVGATVPVFLIEGPVWGTNYDPADRSTTEFGEIVVRFPTCDSALFNVNSNVAGLESGTYSLVRLTELVTGDCVEPPPPGPPPAEPEVTPGLWTGLGVCFYVNAEGTEVVESDECDNGKAYSAEIAGVQIDIDGKLKPELCDANVNCVGAWPITSTTDANGITVTQAICANTAGGIGEIRFKTGSRGFVRAYQGLDTENGLFCYGADTDVAPAQ